MSELSKTKPCPFCGGCGAVMSRPDEYDQGKQIYWVQCLFKQDDVADVVRAMMTNGVVPTMSGCLACTTSYASAKEAIEAWNMRGGRA